ncbi:MAG: ATP-binding protein [Gaiellaceae bacterium]
MSRLPIRLRLTLVFAATLAIVLAAVGFLLYQHLAGSLDRTLDQGLRARGSDVSALVRQADTGLSESQPRTVADAGNGFAQVIDARGRLLDQTPGLGRAALLTSSQLASARHAPLLVRRSVRAGEGVRLLALPVFAQDQRLVVVVGAPLAERDRALSGLKNELLVAGPAALLVALLIGYLVAAAALRPVERMRARAAALSASQLSERLPVARSHDEVSRLGTTLNDMLGRLEVALERERNFLADASHELRTPLALLRAEIELALERPRSPAELEAALRSAGEESERLSQLAEDLLLLARLDQGALPLRSEQIELDDLLSAIEARFDRRVGAAGRTIESYGGGFRITADRLRIEQALGNLVENALRHGSGAIRIGAVERQGWLELRVSDEGSGFPDAFLPRAFERFSRAEGSRGTGGAGLGLAIVDAVAKAHGGTAGATNPPEGGALAWLSLPLPAELRRASSSSAPRAEGIAS